MNIKAKKLDMTQIFSEDGTVSPVTEVELFSSDVSFEAGEQVDVFGTSKGKGFAGVIKRWGFAGGPHSHGQKDKQRTGGSIGAGTYPGRVWKGKKMGGRMGGSKVTVKNLSIVKHEGTHLWVKGAIPGHRNSIVTFIKKNTDTTEQE